MYLLATIHGTLPIILFINLNANFNKFQNTNSQLSFIICKSPRGLGEGGGLGKKVV